MEKKPGMNLEQVFDLVNETKRLLEMEGNLEKMKGTTRYEDRELPRLNTVKFEGVSGIVGSVSWFPELNQALLETTLAWIRDKLQANQRILEQADELMAQVFGEQQVKSTE